MYQITCDDVIIYDLRLNRVVLSPTLDLEVGKNGTLSFIIPPENETYNSINQKKSIIKAYRIDKNSRGTTSTELFRGCAYSVKKDFQNRKQVDCEGELSFFNDSIVRPYNYQGNVENLFRQYVNNHNSVVNIEKRFTARNCAVIDPNDYIIRANINYPTTKSEMDEKLIDILGGHFETGENSDGTRYVDYLQNYSRVSSQIIEFGRNMLDITQHIKTENVATRVIALGHKDDDGNSLTVASVNGGLDYVQDDSAVALFGIIEKTVEYDDVTVPANLLRKANQELQNTINATVSIELNAADLHGIDVNIEAFRIGDNVRIVSIPHKLDRYFLLSKLHLTLDKPSSCRITLGAAFKSLTQKQLEDTKLLKQTIINGTAQSQNIQQQVNTIQTQVRNINNVVVEIPSEYVSTDTFQRYANEINQKIGRVYRVKGSVRNYVALGELTNNQVGDVWNVLSSGANYVYTEDGWDKLSETVDLTAYITTADAESRFITVAVLDNYYTKTEIDELLETYALLYDNLNSTIESLQTRIENLEGGTNNG